MTGRPPARGVGLVYTAAMDARTLGILQPGAKGAPLGAAARARGPVWWCSADRSEASRKRAEAADLRDAGDLAALCAGCGTLLAVCPPAAAEAQAAAVVRAGFRGTYVDANAIAPQTARRLAKVLTAGGARFVDGGLVGPPPTAPGRTRLFLSGDDAPAVAERFAGSLVETVVVAGGPGAASAVKMGYAAWTKGRAALATAVRAYARAEGVEPALLEEWARSQPDFAAFSEGAARATAPKAWRFDGEMLEIARAMEARGLPGGFHRGAAEVFRGLAAFKDAEGPELARVLDALLDGAER